MRITRLVLALALATTTYAQTAPGFYLSVSTNLAVDYLASNVSVTPPGVLLPRGAVLETPSVRSSSLTTDTTDYIVFLIDQDVPRNGTRVSLLHWLQPNLHTSPNSLYLTVSNETNSSTAVGAPYIPPTPPAGSGPHRYTFLLFAQPANWIVPVAFASINPPADSSARIGFNITEFIAVSGLSAPLAANYLQVLNGTAAETSSAATMTMAAPTTSSTPTVSSPVASYTPTPGGAVELRGSGQDIAVGLAMAVVGAGLWMM